MEKIPKALLEKLADPWWRICNLYVIKDEEANICPFVPRSEQIEFYQNQHSRNFILKARKLGMSTLLVLESLDACIFANGGRIHSAIVDRNEKEAQDKLSMAILAWDNLERHPNTDVRIIGANIKRMLKLKSRTNGYLEWDNGSVFEAGVSLRGGTPQRLHISELGYIASHDRRRAEEIKAGSINAVPKSGSVTIETTHEGGKIGMSYEFAKMAMDMTAKGLASELEWKFHFFAWFDHPSYRIEMKNPRIDPETHDYFLQVEKATGRTLDDSRKVWWQSKKVEQREAMFREFPSTPDEAFRAQVSGAIYPHMMTLRANGRIRDFEPDPNAPLFTSWDLGMSDFTPIWLIQFVGRDILWLDWYENEGLGVAHYSSVMREWEEKYQRKIATHFVPHDANKREIGTGKTVLSSLIETGIPSHAIKVVPRTPDIWQGINHVRDILPRSWFHSRCDKSRFTGSGEERLSGVGCLEAYHKMAPTSQGVIREEPCHDDSSHSSDACRTIAEALALGMVDITQASSAPHNAKRKAKIVTGFNGFSGRGKVKKSLLDML